MTGQAWAFIIFQIHVLGPTSWASAWAALDGRGPGAGLARGPLCFWVGGWDIWPIFFYLYQLPPNPCVRTAWARAVIISATVAISMCLLGYGLIKPDCRHTWYVNDGTLGFTLVFHTLLVLLCFLPTSPVLSSSGALPSFFI